MTDSHGLVKLDVHGNIGDHVGNDVRMFRSIFALQCSKERKVDKSRQRTTRMFTRPNLPEMLQREATACLT